MRFMFLVAASLRGWVFIFFFFPCFFSPCPSVSLVVYLGVRLVGGWVGAITSWHLHTYMMLGHEKPFQLQHQLHAMINMDCRFDQPVFIDRSLFSYHSLAFAPAFCGCACCEVSYTKVLLKKKQLQTYTYN